MKIKCSWCKADMGEKPPLEDTSISHSICQECMEKEENENTTNIKKAYSISDLKKL